jgi:alkaline phosphatase/alkaline phosphatase D
MVSHAPATRCGSTVFAAFVSLFALAALTSEAENVREQPPGVGIHLAQGMIAGEVTTASVILQARLTSVVTLTGGDVAGAAGTGCFEVATDTEFKNARRTPWMLATPDADFILKTRVDGLLPATTYHYRLVFGTEAPSAKPGDSASFKTLPEPGRKTAADFILTSCPNYSFFHEGTKGMPAYQGNDRMLGYPALEAIRSMKPDFVILNGDCVYYDHPSNSRAKTQAELRRKWHEQHVQPRFVKLFAHTPTYWLKDDHDHRQNDSDATGNYQPSHQLGIDTFREQVPVVNPADPKAVTYRTHRIGHDLQLWFVEGRDYRSPNKMAAGPDKTLWGAEQKAWLMRTLTESDATFKILVSPTPMVGPDDGYKTDNHVNADGFRHEGEAFFSWLKASGIASDRFFILCGDRHWKYHSRHPGGYEEFSSGALNRENARLGRAPGTPGSSDPDAKIKQHYTDRTPSGGFLRVRLEPAARERPASLELTLHDDRGEVLYRHRTP